MNSEKVLRWATLVVNLGAVVGPFGQAGSVARGQTGRTRSPVMHEWARERTRTCVS